ncbi:MAG: AMP-binding protein, partial [Deltaproteobacteria bacterium]|nr:AMP-binding protein [Deltaproteobacteria bacterium]
PQATAEVLKEGWLYSGDIGHLTEKGNLKITDRKKDIIVTSGGKNVAPQKIENLLKTQRYISQAMVYGDKKNYLTALITLNLEEALKFAKNNHIEEAQIFSHPKIEKLIADLIAETNKALPSFETIKKFRILKNDFSIETGELTPSLKVKKILF